MQGFYLFILLYKRAHVKNTPDDCLKVSHPRCVVKIQVREENPILYSHKTQLNIKLSLLQHYNMFRPKLLAIFRLYMKPI